MTIQIDLDLLENAIADYHAMLAGSRLLSDESLTAFQTGWQTAFPKSSSLRPHFMVRPQLQGYLGKLGLIDVPTDRFLPTDQIKQSDSLAAFYGKLPIMQEFSQRYNVTYIGTLDNLQQIKETKLDMGNEVFPTVQEGLIIFKEAAVTCSFYKVEGQLAFMSARIAPDGDVPIFIIDGRNDTPMRPADPEGCV